MILAALMPNSKEGTVVASCTIIINGSAILDNVAFHKSEKVARIIKKCGAWLLFLPPYSPDLNPIELAFSKLKTLLRKHAARTYDEITEALGQICELYSTNECRNYLKAAGYEAD